MKNTIPAVSAGREPRGLVKVNGARLTGWYGVVIDSNTFYEPDKFTLHLAMSGLPTAMNAAWWASTASDIVVEVFAGFPSNPDSYGPSDLTSIFYGIADELEFDWRALTIEATGRDLKINGKFAVKVGLSPSLQVNDVSFQNASWGSRADLGTFKQLDVELRGLAEPPAAHHGALLRTGKVALTRVPSSSTKLSSALWPSRSGCCRFISIR